MNEDKRQHQLPIRQNYKLHSSYESLDKFNYALETLKLTDDFYNKRQNIMELISNNSNKIINELEPALQQSPQKYYQKLEQIHAQDKPPKAYKTDTNSLKKPNVNASDDYEAMAEKQKQLSDWYYIKTSPKSRPKPTSPYERRKAKNYNHYTTTTSPPDKNTPTTNSTSAVNNNSTNNGSGITNMNKSNEIISTFTKNESPNQFVPMQKYKSNDFIEKREIFEGKSPVQSYKCFNMKLKNNCNNHELSSSFEHVSGLYENHLVVNSNPAVRNAVNEQLNQKYREAMMRPLPQVPPEQFEMVSRFLIYFWMKKCLHKDLFVHKGFLIANFRFLTSIFSKFSLKSAPNVKTILF